jgi:putative sterol carrier protein
LEEQAKVNLFLKGRPVSGSRAGSQEGVRKEEAASQKYKLLSRPHRERLVDLVNNDNEAQELGKKYGLTCTLAVKNAESGEVMRFCYEQGRIVKADEDQDAQFMIIGSPEILTRVFNREIDPFVALPQGKVKTKGDFSQMSKWYPVMVRTFQLWEQAPVE